MNAIYLQAPHVPVSDYKGFIGLCYAWHECVRIHHHGEETGFFRVIEERYGKGTMSVSFAEHAAFHDGLESFVAYLEGLKGREAEFDGGKLIKLIDAFVGPLNTHLQNEIGTILELSKLDKPETIMKLWTDAVQKELKGMSLKESIISICLIVFSNDLTYEGGLHSNFPPAPAPVLFLARRVFSWWSWSSWQFMPLDSSGRPRALRCSPIPV
jgi:hemerythrin-like domain-containing protein